jgi:hypothetical protein
MLIGSPPAGPFIADKMPMPRLRSSVGAIFGAIQHFANGGGEILEPGARNNDCVPPAMRFFGDTQKLPAIVFTKLDVEMLTFDLKLFRLDDIVHF